jgi:hypothetical protein
MDQIRGLSILRACLALQEMQTDDSLAFNVAVLLRQTIQSYRQKRQVSSALWSLLSRYEEQVGLKISEDDEPELITIDAEMWHPLWLPTTQFAPIEGMAQRRIPETVIGDGLLYSMTEIAGKAFSSYQSISQKLAVEMCLFAPLGSTILITLPTGNGKSMCTLLPAWLDSDGGRKGNGTTLVIVPTIALAEDQVRHAAPYFNDAFDTSYTPHCWTGSTTAQERDIILDAISKGTLPILYTSPEALLSSGLRDLCLETGSITRLVIDEAHLVEYWGAQFRVEFQLLSAYRQRLLEATQGRLRTILLSATVTDNCQELLEKLFSPDCPLTSFCANALRPEIATWFSKASSAAEQKKRILEALTHLPRPAILYVTRIEPNPKIYYLNDL